jgi:hypothetical protein
MSVGDGAASADVVVGEGVADGERSSQVSELLLVV